MARGEMVRFIVEICENPVETRNLTELDILLDLIYHQDSSYIKGTNKIVIQVKNLV